MVAEGKNVNQFPTFKDRTKRTLLSWQKFTKTLFITMYSNT